MKGVDLLHSYIRLQGKGIEGEKNELITSYTVRNISLQQQTDLFLPPFPLTFLRFFSTNIVDKIIMSISLPKALTFSCQKALHHVHRIINNHQSIICLQSLQMYIKHRLIHQIAMLPPTMLKTNSEKRELIKEIRSYLLQISTSKRNIISALEQLVAASALITLSISTMDITSKWFARMC